MPQCQLDDSFVSILRPYDEDRVTVPVLGVGIHAMLQDLTQLLQLAVPRKGEDVDGCDVHCVEVLLRHVVPNTPGALFRHVLLSGKIELHSLRVFTGTVVDTIVHILLLPFALLDLGAERTQWIRSFTLFWSRRHCGLLFYCIVEVEAEQFLHLEPLCQ